MKKESFTGIILAGGENKRFAGNDKAFIPIGPQQMIDPVYHIMRELFNEVIVITNRPGHYLNRDLQIAADILRVRSSLTGIHAGLFYAATPYAFISACDTPFVKKSMIEMLLDATDEKVDVTVPQTAAGLEPLCAVYSQRCLEPIRRLFSKNQLQIKRFFDKVRVRHIPESALRKVDPELISFFNINTPEDLEAANDIRLKQRRSRLAKNNE